jgi:hypothetical protein
MKKGILIFIAAITIVAFVLVGFLGSVPTGIIPIVYIDTISIKTMDGETPTINPSSGVKTISIDWYDRDSFQTLTYEGETYIGYVFVTSVLPDNATNGVSFEYTVPENNYVILNPYSDISSHQGSFLIKQTVLSPESITAGRTTKKVDVTVKATDGGLQPTDTVRLVIDYAKQPLTSSSASS